MSEWSDDDPAKREDADEHTAASRAHVTVCDINQAMLDVGKRKAQDLGIHKGLVAFL